MPFELTNAPASFMRTMNNLFSDLLNRGVVDFIMDDVLIYRSTIEEHEILLKAVFTRLKVKQFYSKLKKYQFFKSMTTFLDHDITSDASDITSDITSTEKS